MHARPDTMKAIVQDRYGSPDVLELREIAGGHRAAAAPSAIPARSASRFRFPGFPWFSASRRYAPSDPGVLAWIARRVEGRDSAVALVRVRLSEPASQPGSAAVSPRSGVP